MKKIDLHSCAKLRPSCLQKYIIFYKLTHVISISFTKINNIYLTHGYMASQEQALKNSQVIMSAFF